MTEDLSRDPFRVKENTEGKITTPTPLTKEQLFELFDKIEEQNVNALNDSNALWGIVL